MFECLITKTATLCCLLHVAALASVPLLQLNFAAVAIKRKRGWDELAQELPSGDGIVDMIPHVRVGNVM